MVSKTEYLVYTTVKTARSYKFINVDTVIYRLVTDRPIDGRTDDATYTSVVRSCACSLHMLMCDKKNDACELLSRTLLSALVDIAKPTTALIFVVIFHDWKAISRISTWQELHLDLWRDDAVLASLRNRTKVLAVCLQQHVSVSDGNKTAGVCLMPQKLWQYGTVYIV